MSSRSYFLDLTRLAFLDAMALLLISLQFIAPPLIIINLIVVPAIFALQIYYISVKAWMFSGFALVILSSAGFGIDSGAWTAVFLILGFIFGVCNKLQVPSIVSILSAVIVFIISIAGTLELLRRFARISWDEITKSTNTIPDTLKTPLLYIIIIGIVVWGLISCIAANGFFRRVIKQLEGEVLL